MVPSPNVAAALLLALSGLQPPTTPTPGAPTPPLGTSGYPMPPTTPTPGAPPPPLGGGVGYPMPPLGNSGYPTPPTPVRPIQRPGKKTPPIMKRTPQGRKVWGGWR